ncbi:hypothetical protein SCHPADRAFT_948215 [Schizopora paradoxa]|uniref:Uncharacterized protein n=1 Tax=Schizopora paradoxa TaxID=27342 RepID=A0A0H2QY36_9AGAM|nr:hypothetical protein SCHPADRAFT_948215 [Schizopora paradoxa]
MPPSPSPPSPLAIAFVYTVVLFTMCASPIVPSLSGTLVIATYFEKSQACLLPAYVSEHRFIHATLTHCLSSILQALLRAGKARIWSYYVKTSFSHSPMPFVDRVRTCVDLFTHLLHHACLEQQHV